MINEAKEQKKKNKNKYIINLQYEYISNTFNVKRLG